MDGISQLEMLEEEERHARMRLEADRARLAHSDREPSPEEHLRLGRLERDWRDAAKRLHRARPARGH
jgi:hypothetical protein